MTKPNAPTLRARWIGKTMRELRLQAGVQVNELVDLLKRHRSTVAKFESGELPIPPDVLLYMLDIYRVSDIEERTRILQLAEQVAQRGWWDGFNFDSGLANYVWLEGKARTISIFDATTIPGLVQEASFSEAIMSHGPLKDDELALRRALEARSIRRQVLQQPGRPALNLLLHQSVLMHEVGDSGTHAKQLEHLLKLTSSDGFSIRVLPASSWQHVALTVQSNFSIFELPEEWPNVLAVETPLGVSYRESPDIEPFEEAFNELWTLHAMDEYVSADLLESLKKEVTNR